MPCRDPHVQPMPFVDIADGRVSRLHCIFRPVAAVPPSLFASAAGDSRCGSVSTGEHSTCHAHPGVCVPSTESRFSA